jgi:hypothetical protein
MCFLNNRCVFWTTDLLAQLNAVLWAKPFIYLRLRSGVLLICAKDLFVAAIVSRMRKSHRRQRLVLAASRGDPAAIGLAQPVALLRGAMGSRGAVALGPRNRAAPASSSWRGGPPFAERSVMECRRRSLRLDACESAFGADGRQPRGERELRDLHRLRKE